MLVASWVVAAVAALEAYHLAVAVAAAFQVVVGVEK